MADLQCQSIDAISIPAIENITGCKNTTGSGTVPPANPPSPPGPCESSIPPFGGVLMPDDDRYQRSFLLGTASSSSLSGGTATSFSTSNATVGDRLGTYNLGCFLPDFRVITAVSASLVWSNAFGVPDVEAKTIVALYGQFDNVSSCGWFVSGSHFFFDTVGFKTYLGKGNTGTVSWANDGLSCILTCDLVGLPGARNSSGYIGLYETISINVKFTL